MQDKEIEKISSEIVYQNRWMIVREDKIIRADGSKGIYGVVQKSDFAVIAAIEDNNIYLVEQYRYPAEGRFWELPQGSLELSNIDPLDLAKAELLEETGLTANTMVHAGHLFCAYGYSNQGYNVFLASGLKQESQDLEESEHGLIAKAFSIQEFEAMIINGVIKDATTIASYSLLKMKQLF